MAYLDGAISYNELITLQVLKYQYPNGHKTDISSSLRSTLPAHLNTFESLSELQTICKIQIRPAVVIWQVLAELYHLTGNSCLSINELQTFVVRCTSHSDVLPCVASIRKYRTSGKTNILPVSRSRRNMQDWVKILCQTPLFERINQSLALSQYAIDNIDAINDICKQLSSAESFWYISTKDKDYYKQDWFSFYGNIDVNTQLIPHEEAKIEKSISETSDSQVLPSEHSDISLSPFKYIERQNVPNHKPIISEYDYNKSKAGSILHDSMVNLIADNSIKQGATVFVDPRSVDLYIQYKEHEFIVEVKSITPSNFIARMRTAIGQIHQYNYLLKKPFDEPRRLGLAFTANIPQNAWQIPFIKDYLNMDLLCLDSGNHLCLYSNNTLSFELFGLTA